jgi:hypothetical protein
MLSPITVLALVLWAPLIALFLMSLSLIAARFLPGIPRWAKRLTAPPFYFVSLPVATLIVGMEIPLWLLYLACEWMVGVPVARDAIIDRFYIMWAVALFLPVGSPVVVISYLLAMAVSGCTLWRSLVSQEQKGMRPLVRTNTFLKVVVLSASFMWAVYLSFRMWFFLLCPLVLRECF